MISGGIATLYVSDIGRAVRFYVETLGFKLRERAGEPGHEAGRGQWASVDAGNGFVLGLHQVDPAAHPGGPAPGARGSISVGFGLNQPIDEVVLVLENRGVVFHGPVRADGPVKLAFFGDPDGNALYLAEDAKS